MLESETNLEEKYQIHFSKHHQIVSATKGLNISCKNNKEALLKRKFRSLDRPSIRIHSTPLSSYQLTEERIPKLCSIPSLKELELEEDQGSFEEDSLFFEQIDFKKKKSRFHSNLSLGNKSKSSSKVDVEYILD